MDVPAAPESKPPEPRTPEAKPPAAAIAKEPAAQPAPAPKPGKPAAPAKSGLSNEDALLAAYLVQKNKSAKQLQSVQASTVNQVTKIKKQQKLVHKVILYVIIILLMALLRELRVVKFKYEPYITQLKAFRDADTTGQYDFGDPFRLAWGCEYPNFTKLLLSKVANPQYPRAVIYAISTQEILDKLTDLPSGEAAKYLYKMRDTANGDVDLSAWDIICEGLKDLNFYTCSYACMPADRLDAAEAVTDVVIGGAVAGMLGDSLVSGLGATISGTTGKVIMAAAVVTGALLGVGVAVGKSNALADQCALLTDCIHVSNTGC